MSIGYDPNVSLNYEYKMFQMPTAINVGKKDKGSEAATYLEKVVKENAIGGWEFYRVDSFSVEVQAGCLMALLGQKSTNKLYYIVTFRRLKN